MADKIGVPAGDPREVIVWSCENEAYTIVNSRMVDEAEEWTSTTESPRQKAEPTQEKDTCGIKLASWNGAEQALWSS